MLTTTNYKFKKPELTDSPPDITVMNDNWDIIDTNLKKLNDDKAPKDVATTSKDGLMSKTDKSKLDGIASGANAYVHPSKHPASIITEDATHRFLTDAERKLIQAWETFKASGGTVGGDILLSGLLKFNDTVYVKANGAELALGSSGKNQLIMNYTELRSTSNKSMNLGGDLFRWRELFLGEYSRDATGGYTPLSNGFILQWGDFTTSGINANAEINPQRIFPVAFPSSTLAVIPFVKKCVTDQGATLNAEVVIKQVTINSKSAFQVKIKAKEYVSGGVVIGYMAIGR